MSSHIAHPTRDVEAARQRHVPDAPWTAESVGYFIQAVLQGSFNFAKAKGGSDIARRNLIQLRLYLERPVQLQCNDAARSARVSDKPPTGAIMSTHTVRLHRVIAVRPEIPPEACYLGWQKSLRNLARLVEPEMST